MRVRSFCPGSSLAPFKSLMTKNGGGSAANIRKTPTVNNADARTARANATQNPDLDRRTFIQIRISLLKSVLSCAASAKNSAGLRVRPQVLHLRRIGFLSGFELNDESKVPTIHRKC